MESNKIKAKVHRLPTEGKSFIYEDDHKHLWYVDGKDEVYGERHHDIMRELENGIPQHLYITSDDEIKEGDWVIDEFNDIAQYNGFPLEGNERKIIATTDPKLTINRAYYPDKRKQDLVHKKGLPQIPQSFIEDYCKAGGIDKVLVECELKMEVTSYSKSGCGNFEPLSTGKPKLNPDNTIIIHPVEEKMIPLSEVKELIKKYNSDLFTAQTMELPFDGNKWIEENI